MFSHQPRFIVDQVTAACKYHGVTPAFTLEAVTDALNNLYPRQALHPHATLRPHPSSGRLAAE